MLIRRIKVEGEPRQRDKFERLYIKYRYKMYYVALSILHHQQDAEDAVHNSFLAVAGAMSRLGDVDSAETAAYMYRVVKNEALNIYNYNMRRVAYELSIEDVARDEPDAVSDCELEQLARALEFDEVVRCIESLPEHYRAVLELHFGHQYTAPQIAHMLGLKLSTVKQRLVRGKKMLLSRLEGDK